MSCRGHLAFTTLVRRQFHDHLSNVIPPWTDDPIPSRRHKLERSLGVPTRHDGGINAKAHAKSKCTTIILWHGVFYKEERLPCLRSCRCHSTYERAQHNSNGSIPRFFVMHYLPKIGIDRVSFKIGVVNWFPTVSASLVMCHQHLH